MFLLAFVHGVLLLLYLVRFGGAPFFPLLESPKRLLSVVFPFDCLSMLGVVDIDECSPSPRCILTAPVYCIVSQVVCFCLFVSI